MSDQPEPDVQRDDLTRLVCRAANEDSIEDGNRAYAVLRDALASGNTKPVETVVARFPAQSLVLAASHGDVDLIRAMLAAGASVPAQGSRVSAPTPLFAAIAGGHADAARALLSVGADANAAPGGLTPLFKAVEMNRVDLIALLVEGGADPKRHADYGKTVVHVALEHGRLDLLPMLVAAGADLDDCDMYGKSPLAMAAGRGDVQAVKELIRLGAAPDPSRAAPASAGPARISSVDDIVAQMHQTMGQRRYRPQTTALIEAAKEGHADVVDVLLKAGADPLARDRQALVACEWAVVRGHDAISRRIDESGGLTPAMRLHLSLCSAAQRGDLDQVKGALAAGADPNRLDQYLWDGEDVHGGFSPLMYAAAAGHVAVVEFLLARGARIGQLSAVPRPARRSALHLACAQGKVGVVRVLLAAGAKSDQPDEPQSGNGRAALQIAAAANHPEVVETLLKLGTTPAHRTAALFAAAAAGSIEAARTLLDAGVAVDARASDQSTPLIIAAARGQAAMVEFLLARGADPNATRKQWGGALHAAVVTCALHSTTPQETDTAVRTVQALLRAGAKTEAKDREGETALLKAARIPELVEALLHAGANANATDAKGYDALVWATVYAADQSVELLLKAGTDPNRICPDGTTVLDQAEKRSRWLKEACSPTRIVDLLRSADAKHAAELEAGRQAIERATQRKQQKAEDARREEEADRAVRPDFSRAAKSKAYAKVVQRLAEITSSEPLRSEEVPGLVYCKAEYPRARELVIKHRDELKKMGGYVFCCNSSPLAGTSDTIAMLPTTDQLEAVAAMGVCGPNQSVGLAKVIAGLKAIHELTPFVLEKISYDTLEGHFLRKHTKPGQIARIMYSICPDIVVQGTETLPALTKELRKSDRFYLWWD